MNCIKVSGGHRLSGFIHISGAKNAALPLTCLSLMTNHTLTLHNIPNIVDIMHMHNIMQTLGTSIQKEKDQWTMDTKHVKSHIIPKQESEKMRASILLLGAMLGREGKVRFFMPGGCALTFGMRPINYHLDGLKALGVNIDVLHDNITATAPKGRIHGGCYTFPQPTVTGTLNLLFAAVLARGETVLHNIASEPEIMDTISCLRKMGAEIQHSQNSLWIQGKDQLHGAVHNIMSDRIEMGSYMIAAAMTRGDLVLHGDCIQYLDQPIEYLKKMGILVEIKDPTTIRVTTCNRPEPIHITTGPFPEFPTDLQAQFMALMCLADGKSVMTEKIWENRFMHVKELNRMGAKITTSGNKATIVGQPFLQGANVYSTDLRASMSLLLAGLAGRGQTTVHNIHHLDRGYPSVEEKLSLCQADIQRIGPHHAWQHSHACPANTAHVA